MPTGLRQRKKEQTRDALATAAVRLIGKRGFDGVTVEEIALAADVSPRTFFRYFGSKEDVLFADGDRNRSALLEAIDAQSADLGALDALERALVGRSEDYESHRAQLRARRRIVLSTPSLHTRTVEREQRWEQDLVESLRAAGRADDLGDLDLRLLVAATMAALRVAVDTWLESDGSAIRELFELAFSRLRAGFDH